MPFDLINLKGSSLDPVHDYDFLKRLSVVPGATLDRKIRPSVVRWNACRMDGVHVVFSIAARCWLRLCAWDFLLVAAQCPSGMSFNIADTQRNTIAHHS